MKAWQNSSTASSSGDYKYWNSSSRFYRRQNLGQWLRKRSTYTKWCTQNVVFYFYF